MRWLAACLCAVLAGAAGVASAQEAVATIGRGDQALVLRSTTDIGIIRPTLELFVEETPGLEIRYEQWGSNALYAASRAECAGSGNAVDVVFSSAVHQMVALVNDACARTYESPATLALPTVRRWRDELWGVTEEPAVIVYNTSRIAARDVPRSRFALLDLMRADSARLRGRIATYDIEESGLGYLFAFSDSLEATTFGALLEGFARTEAVATCCSSEIIRGVADGTYLIAYNVLGSYVANSAPENVGVVLPEDYTLFLTRAFMIPRRAANPGGAGRLLDFLLSPQGQASLGQAGLIFSRLPDETGLLPSARRSIPLAPPLLVALDRSTSAGFISLWRQAFAVTRAP